MTFIEAAVAAMPVADEEEKHPEARLYDASRDAKSDVDAAILRAEADGRLVLLVLGANWCHDSRAFAGWTQEPRFQQLIAEHYELVFVNVGMPQTGDGHNLDIARRFDIEVKGTPTVIILSPLGKVLNADTAKTWRNAASHSEDAIFDELLRFTGA
ncbi:thioredoxin family protein [Pontixanthobacter aquaemixtae]|uniref:Thioredoxin family protein n=1 Tax=Pontixanthobacter aquaemixtae TaxID=1958940 RepID=A0A845A2D0_9SPHN|nr:thioredoxin family protein [Pontixanthobacter aquaemixtae]MXO91779.1 thioredoxin family protein [Pontixanthobacter aquaemixtae]